jgi:hypothetical protein
MAISPGGNSYIFRQMAVLKCSKVGVTGNNVEYKEWPKY